MGSTGGRELQRAGREGSPTLLGDRHTEGTGSRRTTDALVMRVKFCKAYLRRALLGREPTAYNEDVIIIQASSTSWVKNMQKFTLLSPVLGKTLRS